MEGRRLRVGLVLAGGLALAIPLSARAQDDGPRVYQLAPVGFQNITAFLVNKRGDEGPDPGQTTPGSETRSDVFVVRYARTFDLADRQFTPFVILPVGRIRVTQGTGSGSESSGLGDGPDRSHSGPRRRAPALTPSAYQDYRPVVSMSLLARAFFPTGAYDRGQPVNLGANRFSFQLGLPTTFMFGQSYRAANLTALEVLPTVSFYDANEQPFGGGKRTQDPLFSVESHLTHSFAPQVWASADLLYRDGGESHTDGRANNDPVHGWTAGGTFAFPAVGGASLILTFEHVVKRWDSGPEGWWFRTALVAPF